MQLEDLHTSKKNDAYIMSGGKSALLKPLKKVIIQLADSNNTSVKR